MLLNIIWVNFQGNEEISFFKDKSEKSPWINFFE